jgi:hypothetical protein
LSWYRAPFKPEPKCERLWTLLGTAERSELNYAKQKACWRNSQHAFISRSVERGSRDLLSPTPISCEAQQARARGNHARQAGAYDGTGDSSHSISLRQEDVTRIRGDIQEVEASCSSEIENCLAIRHHVTLIQGVVYRRHDLFICQDLIHAGPLPSPGRDANSAKDSSVQFVGQPLKRLSILASFCQNPSTTYSSIR